MPTTKQRINITVTPTIEKIIKKLAKVDRVPLATKTSELLKIGVETFLEDSYLAEIADKRSSDKNAKYISHSEVWKKLGL